MKLFQSSNSLLKSLQNFVDTFNSTCKWTNRRKI